MSYHQREGSSGSTPGGGSPQRSYRGFSGQQPGSTSSPFAGRAMPPPSPPQHHTPTHNVPSLSRGPLPPAAQSPQFPPRPYSSGRDLPSISSIQRPGSSMSISSMLGSDMPRVARDRDLGQPASPQASASVPLQRSMPAPPSPSSSRKAEPAPYLRASSPDRYRYPSQQSPRESRASSAGSQARPVFGSPENPGRFAAQPPPDQGYRPLSSRPQPEHGEPQTYQAARHTQHNNGLVPQRPSSQPSQHPYRQEVRDDGFRTSSFGLSTMPEPSREQGYPRADDAGLGAERPSSRSQDAARAGWPAAHEHRAGPEIGPSTGISYNQSLPPGARHGEIQPRDRAIIRAAPTAYDTTSDPARAGNSARAAEPYEPSHGMEGRFEQDRAAAQPPYPRPPNYTIDGVPRQSWTIQPPPQYDQSGAKDQAYPQPYRGDGREHHNLGASPRPSWASQPHGYGQMVEQHQQPGKGDDAHPQRTPSGPLLNVASDSGRRGGRLSPLPQAVQGAQVQHVGPAGGPGIKMEFGRPFSGIGSGVSSAMANPSPSPVPNGDATQSAPSDSLLREMASQEQGTLGGPTNGDDGHLAHSSSRGGRKVKNGRLDTVLGGMTSSVVRGAKRTRHPHVHHHHQQGHRYAAKSKSFLTLVDVMLTFDGRPHHHHHKAEDEPASPPPMSYLGPQDSKLARPAVSAPQAAASTQGTQFRHHHHHHHHTSAAATAAASTSSSSSQPFPQPAPSRHKPTTIVRSQSVIDGVAHLPSHHLGSMLYESSIDVSSTSRLGFETTPKAIPNFEGHENCLFTVRVNRLFLTPRRREEIVERNYLWGTDIYSRESDIIAAACHTGWIRGEWDSSVDIEMLDLNRGNESNGTSTTPSGDGAPGPIKDGTVFTSLPKSPIVPPPNLDLHITVRILPPLVQYNASIRRGVASEGYKTSRMAGTSFMIEKIRWVDEGPRGSQPRGAAGRRKRLREYNLNMLGGDDGETKFKAKKDESGKLQFKWGFDAVPLDA
ncbi:MAG: hypothetical protein M1825_001615 [Sarcosagium campestre]|nr:MAG: hypothetical protein M1825_001615 [Sarcosagium campestre]